MLYIEQYPSKDSFHRYEPHDWQNNGPPAINETHLNEIEDGIDDVSTFLQGLLVEGLYVADANAFVPPTDDTQTETTT